MSRFVNSRRPINSKSRYGKRGQASVKMVQTFSPFCPLTLKSVSPSLAETVMGQIMKFLKTSATLLFLFFFTVSMHSQTPVPKPTPTPKVEEDEGVVKVDSRLVVVPVSVTDAAGQAVLG